ncbi:MAG: penicillin-binding protein [Chloroflexota bacterium]|jgi:membrane peptidoglycan carboxypeptidase
MASKSSHRSRGRNQAVDKSSYPISKRRRKQVVKPSIIPRLLVGCLSTFVLIGFVGIALAFVAYSSLTASLIPRLESIKGRTSFETSRLYDRNGQVLYEFFGDGKRTKVPLQRISPNLINGTISIEDKTFYTNPGVDYVGIARGLFGSLTAGSIVGGGSTISQQVIKQVVLTEQERAFDLETRVRRKIVEIVLAQEMSNQYSKDEILELYLNEVYYGNLAYGIEAASNTYFKTTAANLTLHQSAFLAGMPQLPNVYDPYLHTSNNIIPGITLQKGWLKPGYDLGDNTSLPKWRQIAVLRQMVENGYVTEAEAVAAAREDLVFAGPEVPINAPHFVFYVRKLLEAEYGAQFATLGYSIYTTIDLDLQRATQRFATERIGELQERNINNAAVVVMQPNSGQILAMVGSVDYNKVIPTNNAEYEGNVLDGQVNVATSLRQPGSALKPFTFLSAMERGLTPATVFWDIKRSYPSIDDKKYEPNNYNGKFNGPLRMRQALANSLNMPAIEALRYAGVGHTIGLLQRAGLSSFQRGEGFYGLALTLGGGEVTPLELTAAYNTLASEGRYFAPEAILKIVDNQGTVILEYTRPQVTASINPELVSIIVDMMSDDNARQAIWGLNSPLKLSRPAAVKTGTSNDWRDAWALGFTPYVTVGVWTGNNNNEPTAKVESLTGGGIIWRNVMEYMFNERRFEPLLAEPFNNRLVLNFSRPAGVQERPICPLPGAFNNRNTELFTRTMNTNPVPGPARDNATSIDLTVQAPAELTDDPCAGLMQKTQVVKLVDSLPLSGVITDTAVITTNVCLPTDGVSIPQDRIVEGVTWILPPDEPDILTDYAWEVVPNIETLQPPILPFDAKMIPACTNEMLTAFGPPVEGAIRMPNLQRLDAQAAVDTLTALGIDPTLIYVDLQTRERIPDVFDQYAPNQVISTMPGADAWILPGQAVIIGARAP